MMFRLAAAFSILGVSVAFAQQGTVQQAMPFETCVQHLQVSRAGATQAPTTTIDTGDTKQMQFPVKNGQITVTCSRASQQFTIEQR
jgi:hypothetical protein